MRGAIIIYLALSCSLSVSPLAFSPECQAKESSKSSAKSKEFMGMADYYHHKFYGMRTASGEVLKKERLTAAHRTLPFGTKLRVINKRNGQSCIVVVNDRGPFTHGKVIDLSHAAAKKLGVLQAGTALVACKVVEAGDDEDEDE